MSLFTSSTSFVAEAPTLYVMSGDNQFVPVTPERVLEVGATYLASLIGQRDVMTSPDLVKKYISLRIASLEHEVFGMMYLDAQNRVLDCGEMFRGSVNQASVYPREVVKEALRLNASALILYHNHPSGRVEPSRADELLTQSLKSALALVDIRVLDHIIVGPEATCSMAEKGLM